LTRRATAEMSSLASRAHAFIARHTAAWELGMAGLAIVYVALGFADETPAIAAAERILTIVFVAEFSGRLAIAPSRAAYLRGHWIDLVALIPATRALRLLRLLRLVRASAGLFRALSQIERLAQHRNLVWLFVLWLTVAVVCSIWLYMVESDANDAIKSPLDALWWGIVTLTTVGYGDVYPRTAEGRIAAMVLMVVGISLYSAITATITSILIAGRPTTPDAVGQLERLSRLASDGSITPAEFERAKAVVLE
jgi:voltage-gated potassium channel